MAGLTVAAFEKAAFDQQIAQIGQHAWAAAYHHAIAGEVERWHANILEQLVGRDQVGDAPAIAERFADDGRVIYEPVADDLAEEIIPPQSVHELFPISELGHLPTAVHQDHLLEAIVDLRVLD